MLCVALLQQNSGALSLVVYTKSYFLFIVFAIKIIATFYRFVLSFFPEFKAALSF